jgi:hypothetical protein
VSVRSLAVGGMFLETWGGGWCAHPYWGEEGMLSLAEGSFTPDASGLRWSIWLWIAEPAAGPALVRVNGIVQPEEGRRGELRLIPSTGSDGAHNPSIQMSADFDSYSYFDLSLICEPSTEGNLGPDSRKWGIVFLESKSPFKFMSLGSASYTPLP